MYPQNNNFIKQYVSNQKTNNLINDSTKYSIYLSHKQITIAMFGICGSKWKKFRAKVLLVLYKLQTKQKFQNILFWANKLFDHLSKEYFCLPKFDLFKKKLIDQTNKQILSNRIKYLIYQKKKKKWKIHLILFMKNLFDLNIPPKKNKLIRQINWKIKTIVIWWLTSKSKNRTIYKLLHPKFHCHVNTDSEIFSGKINDVIFRISEIFCLFGKIYTNSLHWGASGRLRMNMCLYNSSLNSETTEHIWF